MDSSHKSELPSNILRQCPQNWKTSSTSSSLSLTNSSLHVDGCRIISGEGREQFDGDVAELVVVVDREELTISKLDGVATTEVEGSVEHTVGVVVVVASEQLVVRLCLPYGRLLMVQRPTRQLPLVLQLLCTRIGWTAVDSTYCL